MNFALGQRVNVKAHVETTYNETSGWDGWHVLEAPPECKNKQRKVLKRQGYFHPVSGIIIGRTVRWTGYREWEEDTGSVWYPYRPHKVVLVVTGIQWREPLIVLEEDIEVLGEEQEP